MTNKPNNQSAAKEVESLIELLKLGIEESKNNGDMETSTSWGYQQGILISRKQARLIIQSLTPSHTDVKGNEKCICKIPVKTKIEGTYYFCSICEKPI